MADSNTYYITEQFRAITQIHDFLNENDYVGIDEFVRLSHVVGTAMMTKLRLTPGKNVEPRLSHLFAIVKCAIGVNPIFEQQIILSFEGLNPAFNFDCDLILEKDGKIWLCDFTADDSYDNIQNKRLILNQKSQDPSLHGRNVDVAVITFEPKKFHVNMPFFCLEPDLKRPESFTLRMLETLAAKSSASNDAFINNCDRVLEYASDLLANVPSENKLYNSSKLTEDKIKAALEAASSNSVSDITRLFSIINKKSYRTFTETLQEITAQFHDSKKPFKHRAAVLQKRDNDMAEILYKLRDDKLAKLLHACIIQQGKPVGIRPDLSLEVLSFFFLKHKIIKECYLLTQNLIL